MDLALRIGELENERAWLTFEYATEKDTVLRQLRVELLDSIDAQIRGMYSEPFAPARRGAGGAA
jgi:hypothetical protein